MQPPYGEEPGSFDLIESESGHVIGTLQLDRRDPSRPGRPDESTGLAPGELEVSYVLHPDYWGRGYASEAVAAGLAWVRDKVADGYVIAVTQTTRSIAMLRRLGFVERERFPEFGVEQTLLTRALGDRLDERDGHLLLPSRGVRP